MMSNDYESYMTYVSEYINFDKSFDLWSNYVLNTIQVKKGM